MARALIVGCGCRGRELGSQLSELGWQLRGTSRTAEGAARIDAAGLEGAVADPERPGTVLELVGDVAVVVWLLGPAQGDPELVAAIHGPRLESLLERLVDTPVRGFAYEAPAGELAGRGREAVKRAAATWHIPATVLDEDRGTDGWAERAAAAVSGLLGAGGV